MSAPDSGAGPTHPPGHPGTGSPPPPPPPKDCDCGHGDLPQAFHLTPCPKARPVRLPTLSETVSLARSLLEQAIYTLGRQWDPTSGPRRDDPWDPDGADVYLGRAVADIRSALRELAALTTLISARQSTNSASLPGGPTNHPAMCLAWEYGACECSRHCLGDPRRGPEDHPVQAGEGLSPGLDGARMVARTEGSDGASSPLAGSSHLAVSSLAASGGRTPGLVDSSAPDDGSRTAAPGREAGASSGPREDFAARSTPSRVGALPAAGAGPNPDPRPVRIGSDAPEMTGVPRSPDEQHSARPGVGFTLPRAKRWCSWCSS